MKKMINCSDFANGQINYSALSQTFSGIGADDTSRTPLTGTARSRNAHGRSFSRTEKDSPLSTKAVSAHLNTACALQNSPHTKEVASEVNPAHEQSLPVLNSFFASYESCTAKGL